MLIFQENKIFKKLIKKKKSEYKLDILSNMQLKSKDQKVFWKLLDKLQPNGKDSSVVGISSEKWTNHFRSIFTSKNEVNYPPDSNAAGPLDYEITTEELKKGFLHLKTKQGVWPRFYLQ